MTKVRAEFGVPCPSRPSPHPKPRVRIAGSGGGCVLNQLGQVGVRKRPRLAADVEHGGAVHSAGVGCQPVLPGGGRGGHGVGAEGLDDDVVAVATVDRVVAGAADEHVVTIAAEQHVVAIAADEHVVAVPAVQRQQR